MESARVDQRREAGLRTRTRLMDAALDLLAERGEDGVSLRELTDAAQANVAAVSYHFGSLQSLCDEAIEYALERYLDAQQEAVSAVGTEASLETLAAAFARPMVHALAVGGRELDVIRIVARAGIDPPQGWDRFDPSFDRIRADVLRVLKANVPGVRDQELDLPDALRSRIVELGGPRAGRRRAQEQIREADRATAGTCARRHLPRHEHRLTQRPDASCRAPAVLTPSGSWVAS